MLEWIIEPTCARVRLPHSAFAATITLTQRDGRTSSVSPSARIGTLRMLSPCCSADFTLTAPRSACSNCHRDSTLNEAFVGPTLIFLYAPDQFQWDVGGEWSHIVETWCSVARLDPLVGVLVAAELKQGVEKFVLSAVNVHGVR